jgi:AcrR family transcriptional regulator
MIRHTDVLSAIRLYSPVMADDLTARARIRNVALDHFARLGDGGTTIRGVARDAGVSPGLVQHHFGTKVGLREACDAYVAEYLRREAQHGVTEQGVADPGYLAVAYERAPLLVRYLARALTDGSPAGAALFDELVAITEDYLAGRDSEPALDLRGQAAVFTAMKLGVIVLHEHLSRALGEDALTPATLPRVGTALLDIVSADFAGRELTDLARGGIARYRQGLDHD